MPYYGDYYRGDYYRGDPFLGAIGGIVGGLARKALPALARVAGRAVGILKKPGVGTAVTVAGTALTLRGGAGGAPPPGMRLKPGIRGKLERFLPGGETGYLPRRRMNVTNVKALRRAGRRVRGFLKLAIRLGAIPLNRGKGKLYRRPKPRAK